MPIQGTPTRPPQRGRATAARKAPLLASIAMLAIGSIAAGPGLVAAQTAQDPSNVVLVFDVSNSILLAEDGTNVEFAAALNGIAGRVEAAADDLVVGNAEISFVVFGRTAVIYPQGCGRIALNQDPAAVRRLATCLRSIAAEYRAGANAPVRQRINTQDTDHVAALRRAAGQLPAQGSRSAVIFFTDGQHDPPGTTRDDENVVAEIAEAYRGISPLAILPVGLGSRAGAFETQLQSLFDAYFRDMEPCEGRAAFAWPEVVFASADDAGTAVASALQEVTCSFVFVPPPTAAPSPTPEPTPTPTASPPAGPLGVQLLAGNRSITVQWLPPAAGAEDVTAYLVRCRPEGGDEVVSEVPAPATEAVIENLEPGVAYGCEVAAVGPGGASPPTVSSEKVIVLGIPPAPGQPRAEPGDGSARLTVEPGKGAPAERYIFECTGPQGPVAPAGGSTPSVVVTGLTNGATYTCVAFAENRIGRGPESVASAAFTPCAGFFACNPWAGFAAAGLLVVGLVGGLVLAARWYLLRNRVWITAQVDGGENHPLGWGPEIGVELVRGEGGWYAKPQPFEGSPIRVRYRGKARFIVNGRAGMRDVHQGDPAPVRDDAGVVHTIILRRFRSRPRERVAAARPPAPSPADSAAASQLDGRLGGREDADDSKSDTPTVS